MELDRERRGDAAAMASLIVDGDGVGSVVGEVSDDIGVGAMVFRSGVVDVGR